MRVDLPIRAAMALLLLVTMAGMTVPCVAAPGPGETALHDGGSPSPGHDTVDCHCVCHASWIPVESAACCGDTPLSRVETTAPPTPQCPSLPLTGEPPRSA